MKTRNLCIEIAVKYKHSYQIYKIYLIFFCLTLAINAPAAYAESNWNIDGNIALSTSYVYRGLTYSREPVPRANFYINHNSGIFFNAWVSRDDISGLFGNRNRRDTEFEFSLGYNWQFDELWSLTASHARFEYNQVHQPADHDYYETRLSLNYKDQLTFFAAHTDTVWNSGASLTTISLSTRHAFSFGILAEAEAGWLDYGFDANADFPFLRISAGKALSDNFSTSIEYQYSGSNANRVFDSSVTGSSFIGTIGYSF